MSILETSEYSENKCAHCGVYIDVAQDFIGEETLSCPHCGKPLFVIQYLYTKVLYDIEGEKVVQHEN